MSGVIKRIRVWFSSFLSTETLLREQKSLLFAMLFYFLAVGFSGVFINLLIYTATVNSAGLLPAEAMVNIIRYNLYTYLFMLPLSAVMGIFGKKLSEKNGMLTGLFLHAVLFVVLLVMHTNVIKSIVFVAFLSAAATSVFHVSYHETLGYAFADRSKRLFVSVCGALMTGASVFAPLLAGLLIQYGKDTYGYSFAFGLALVFLAVACGFVLCIRLPKRKKMRTYYASVLVGSIKNKNILYANLAETVLGMRDGVMAFLRAVLLYTISENAFVVAIYIALSTVLQILSERHVQRNINEQNRMGFMLFAVVIMILATTPFWFVFDLVSVFSYGIITALVVGFMTVPVGVIMHWTSVQHLNAANKTLECQSVRSLFVNVGKCVGVLIMMLLYRTGLLSVAIFLLNFLVLGAWLLFSCIGDGTENTSVVEPEAEFESEEELEDESEDAEETTAESVETETEDNAD